MDKGKGRRLFPSRENDQIQLQYFSSQPFENAETNPSTDMSELQLNNEQSPLKPLPSSEKGCCSNKNILRMVLSSMAVTSFALTIALIIEIYKGTADTVKLNGAVVSDNHLCTEIGLEILKKEGSAVDATVASVLCLCVVHPHNTGLGGGGFMLVHEHKNMKTISFDFRETAPLNFNQSVNIPIGVPGLLHGLATAHSEYGKLSWFDVVEPSIKIAKHGFPVSKYLEQVIKHDKASPEIKEMFYTKQQGIKKNLSSSRLNLILEKIATKGIGEFYNGTIGKNILKVVNEHGGNFTFEDLENYSTERKDALRIKWKDFLIYSSQFPSNGPILLKTLKLLENFSLNNTNETALLWERYIQISEGLVDEIAEGILDQESWNSIFSDNKNLTSYPVLVRGSASDLPMREDKGSSVVAVDKEELFVTLISGLGSYFGSQIITEDGIIMNDALNNQVMFSNVLDDDKNVSETKIRNKAYTTLTPVIISKEKNVCGLRLASSSASISLLTQFILQKLVLHLSTSDAIDSLNFDISFREKEIYTLEDHSKPNQDVVKFLESQNYHISSLMEPFSHVNVICKNENSIEAYPNFHGNGSTVEL